MLTRPFGATFGDLLTKPIEKGGLDFGTIGSSAVLGAILATFVIYTAKPHGATADGRHLSGGIVTSIHARFPRDRAAPGFGAPIDSGGADQTVLMLTNSRRPNTPSSRP